jgi:hypothetical protein
VPCLIGLWPDYELLVPVSVTLGFEIEHASREVVNSWNLCLAFITTQVTPIFYNHFIFQYMFWCLCQRSDGCSCVVCFWIFCSISLHTCFCASTMLTLLPCTSKIWSQVLWYLQLCSFCSGLLWLFCASIWILGLFYLLIWRMRLGFWSAWHHWICRLVLAV